MNNCSILQPQPEVLFQKSIENNERSDGRKMEEPRKIEITTGVIKNANGSSKVSIGKTVIICGIKAELTKPSTESPDEGLIIPNIELSPVCSSIFKAGPPCDEAQVLTKFLDNVLKRTKFVDTTQLCLKRDNLVWVLFCDLLCINFDGNLIDASLLALVSALQDVKLPEIILKENDEYETNILKWDHINLQSLPVPLTFAIYNQNLLCDPNHLEEEMTSDMFTVVMGENGTICYIEKAGGEEMGDQSTIRRCLKTAQIHANKIRSYYEQLQKRPIENGEKNST